MQTARKTNLYQFLLANHANLFKIVSHSLRMQTNNSISIKDGYTGYYDFSTGDKGNSVDFLTKYLGYDVDRAVFALIGIQPPEPPLQIKQEQGGGMVYPIMNGNGDNERVRQYLHNKRGIDYDTIDMLIEQNLLYEDTHHNCVFLNAVADWGEIRGTSQAPFHGMIKNNRPDGFWWFKYGDEKEKAVFICESAIDAISLYEIYRLTNQLFPAVFVSIGGVAKQQTIDRLKRAKKKIIIAVDNDDAGNQCRNRNGNTKSYIPRLKDWNEDLKKLRIKIYKEKKGEQ